MGGMNVMSNTSTSIKQQQTAKGTSRAVTWRGGERGREGRNGRRWQVANGTPCGQEGRGLRAGNIPIGKCSSSLLSPQARGTCGEPPTKRHRPVTF